MPNPALHIYNDLDKLAEAFAGNLFNKINELAIKQNIINISLSGGNTPKLVFKLLAKKYKKDIPWHHCHIFWGDERCVPLKSKESNFGEAKRLLFDHIDIPIENIKHINGENDPEKEAFEYSKVILENVTMVNGLPKFDMIILGMGDDGHTASIFPDNLRLIDSNLICAVAEHPENRQKRITMTGKVLNNADITWFLIAGENKAQILERIVKEMPEANNYPAYYINPKHGILEYYLDKAAASLL